MDKNLEYLIDTLVELRCASMQSNEYTIHELIHKYNMLFLGEKFNMICSDDLLDYLKSMSNFDLSKDEFNKLIPQCCKSLNIKYEPKFKLSDIGNPNATIYGYDLTLW